MTMALTFILALLCAVFAESRYNVDARERMLRNQEKRSFASKIDSNYGYGQYYDMDSDESDDTDEDNDEEDGIHVTIINHQNVLPHHGDIHVHGHGGSDVHHPTHTVEKVLLYSTYTFSFDKHFPFGLHSGDTMQITMVMFPRRKRHAVKL